MAESKANSSSVAGGHYSPAGHHDDHHSVNYVAENTSDGGHVKESIDITKSHFGESGITEFNRTQKGFLPPSSKMLNRVTPLERKKVPKGSFIQDVNTMANANTSKYIQPKTKDFARYSADKIYSFEFNNERINNSDYVITRGP